MVYFTDEACLHWHSNAKAVQFLDNSNESKRLKRRKPWELATPRLCHLISKGRSSFKTSFVRSYCSPIGSNVEKSINEVRLLGRVGGEPEKRGTEEHPVVTFQLATDTSYKNSAGELSQKTEWHRIAVFRPKLRDTAYDYLQKGKRVYVSGRISYGSMTTENGNTVNLCSIIAEDIIFLHN